MGTSWDLHGSRNFPEKEAFIEKRSVETDSLGSISKKSKMAVFSLSVNDKYVFDVEPKYVLIE
jgi:hypothetical protein